MRTSTYTNVVLTAIAGLLTLHVVAQFTGPGAPALSVAHASGPDEPRSGGMISAADQRKQIISELKGLAGRIDHLEGLLARGIEVKVTDMPAVKMAREPEREPARQAAPSTPPSIQPSEPTQPPPSGGGQ